MTIVESAGAKSILKEEDPEVYEIITGEEKRRKEGIELIPSENHTSLAVMEAQASVLTDKYAEGYPGKRYYGGCQHYDEIEQLAIDRAKKVFGAEHANVQPHSGAQANMIAYATFMKMGDTILGLNLSHGGHLTHGSQVNFSGKYYNFIAYGVSRDTKTIDYDELEGLAREHKPKMILCGGSAYPRDWDYKRVRKICDRFDAYMMVDIAHIAGLIVGKVQNDPVPYADVVTSTTQKTLRGPRGGIILCRKKYAKQADKANFPLIQAGPLMHTIAAKAVCFAELMKPEFKKYAEQVIKNNKVMTEELMGHGFDLCSGGSDNHLTLIDLRNKSLTGKEVQDNCDDFGISLNKNMVPFDTQTPMVTSGMRLGTPCVTTRGMKEKEMKVIAEQINIMIDNLTDQEAKKKVKARIEELTSKFPLPWEKK